MMISTRGRYALRVLVYLAEQDSNRYVTLNEIACQQEISEKYLESIANSLVKAGFLEGMRGKGGGYRLGRSAEDLNVFDILQAMEGSIAPVACLEEGCKPCPRSADCRTFPMWKGLNDVVRNYLSSFTIRDLAKENGSGFDYVI